mmetsp:Transcript_17958/g.38575  ORF Transcript_17958/g.38575 Transcript_17958/m.38575 type:complete len:228 (-) Transcript_17958:206-889(-)
MHGVKDNTEVLASHILLQHGEVKHLLEGGQVVIHGVHDLNLEVTKLGGADLGQVYIWQISKLQGGNLHGLPIDLVSDPLRRRLTSTVVELNAKIIVRAAGVVAGSHEKTTVQLPAANEGRHGWRCCQSVLTNDDLFEAVSSSKLDDDLGSFLAIVATVATKSKGLALDLIAKCTEKRLHPVGKIVLAHEHLGALSETTGTGLLALNGLSRHLLQSYARCCHSGRLLA